MNYPFGLISIVLFIFGIFLSVFLGLFLFWRAGRREYLESRIIFDSSAMFFLGFLLLGRLADFFVRYDFYKWSLKRLLFFNAFSGFDFFWAVGGGVVFAWIYFSRKRENFWKVFDLAAAPIAFGLSIFLLFDFLTKLVSSHAKLKDFRSLLWFGFYFFIFIVIKRLEKQKKHRGFFVSFFLVFSSLLNIVVLGFFWKQFGNRHYYFLVLNVVVAFIAALSWYFLGKRKLLSDLKSFLGWLLLVLFGAKRTITSLKGANNAARFIILTPFYFLKLIYFLVKYIGCEIKESFVDLAHAFGIGK